LAKHSTKYEIQYAEIALSERESKSLANPSVVTAIRSNVSFELVCIRRAETFDFVSTDGNATTPPPAVREQIDRDRNCPKWMEYHPGISPGRHVELWKMLELEQRQQQFEKMMEQRRQEVDSQNRRLEWTLICIGIGIAAVQVVVGVWGSDIHTFFKSLCH
jgi:hypothetical protein